LRWRTIESRTWTTSDQVTAEIFHRTLASLLGHCRCDRNTLYATTKTRRRRSATTRRVRIRLRTGGSDDNEYGGASGKDNEELIALHASDLAIYRAVALAGPTVVQFKQHCVHRTAPVNEILT
jgi:hypothetical protein